MYPELSKAKLSAVPQIFSILFARVLSLGFIQIHKKKTENQFIRYLFGTANQNLRFQMILALAFSPKFQPGCNFQPSKNI